jgi:hypothetical protein
MTKLDEALRDAVRDLSDQGTPPENLGRAALAAGHRLRYRRSALTTVAAMAAVTAVAAPVLVVDTIGDRSTGSASSPTPSSSPTYPDEPYPGPTGVRNPPLNLPTKLVTFAGMSLTGGGTPLLLSLEEMAGTAKPGMPSRRPTNPDAYPSFVYDSVKKAYVKVAASEALPNRAGTLAIVKKQDRTAALGLLDIRTNKIDWTVLNTGAKRGGHVYYRWSPDDGKALIAADTGFTVYDVASRTFSPPARLDSKYGMVNWHPNGRELVATENEPYDYGPGPSDPTSGRLTGSGSPNPRPGASGTGGAVRTQTPSPTAIPEPRPSHWISQVRRLQVFDLAGRAVRTIPVPGSVTETSQWSPDRKRVVVRDPSNDHNLLVRDASTGKVITTILGADPNYSDRGMMWLDNERVLVPGWDGQRGQHVMEAFGMNGRKKNSYPIPTYANGYDPVIYPTAS